MDDRLLETLRDAQRFGFFGSRAIDEAAEHSQGFADALGSLAPGSTLVDLGSGGGLPGLVLASCYPHVSITLIDRREKRTDFLRRAVRRLEFDHVEVLADDVKTLLRAVGQGERLPFDVVTARGFGPPATTLNAAAGLIGSSGCIVISEPPTGDRWETDLVTNLGLTRVVVGHVSLFRPIADSDL